MMTDELKDKIAKVYELVNRGATEGERSAARRAMDRLMKKYNLEESDLCDIGKRHYAFKYSSMLEQGLLCHLVNFFLPEVNIQEDAYRTSYDAKALVACREIKIRLTYVDYVMLDSAYEYFRVHMKGQWNKTCAPILARCRKAKTRNLKRKELQNAFLEQYVIASGLVPESNLRKVSQDELSSGELERLRALAGIEGGKYHTQLHNGLMLEAAAPSKPIQGSLF